MLIFRLSIVESIPENLTYPSTAPSHGTTYEGWKMLLKAATKTVDLASYYWTLQGHGQVTDVTDKQVAMIHWVCPYYWGVHIVLRELISSAP